MSWGHTVCDLCDKALMGCVCQKQLIILDCFAEQQRIFLLWWWVGRDLFSCYIQCGKDFSLFKHLSHEEAKPWG